MDQNQYANYMNQLGAMGAQQSQNHWQAAQGISNQPVGGYCLGTSTSYAPGSVVELPRIIEKAKEALKQPQEKTMFGEIVKDVKGFVIEHRGAIYFVAIALLIDHFVFAGAFKDRLKAMAEKIVGKIEQKIEDAK